MTIDYGAIPRKIAEWRSYDDSNFDGLDWPVAEFLAAAALVEELHAEPAA